MFEAAVNVNKSGSTKVDARDFVRAPEAMAYSKGDEQYVFASLDDEQSASPRFFAGLGVTGGTTGGNVWLPSLRLGIVHARNWNVSLFGALGRGEGFNESQGQVRTGRDWRRGLRWRSVAGLEAGAGLAMQSVDSANVLLSGMGTLIGRLGFEHVGRNTNIGLYASVGASVLRLDGELATVVRPGMSLELAF